MGRDNPFQASLYPEKKRRSSSTPSRCPVTVQVAYFSDDVSQQLEGDGVVNQRVGVKRSQVFPRIALVVHGAQVRPNFMTVFNSTNREGEGASCSNNEDYIFFIVVEKAFAALV